MGESLKQPHYLAAALKAPRITESATWLADQGQAPKANHPLHRGRSTGPRCDPDRGRQHRAPRPTAGTGKPTPPWPGDSCRPLLRHGLIVIDEVGYLPFEQVAANLFVQLVSSRYEHASLILTSKVQFSGWGSGFGD